MTPKLISPETVSMIEATRSLVIAEREAIRAEAADRSPAVARTTVDIVDDVLDRVITACHRHLDGASHPARDQAEVSCDEAVGQARARAGEGRHGRPCTTRGLIGTWAPSGRAPLR